MYSILFLAISSFVICLILTPLVRTWFHRQGVLDHPDEGRKLHSCPIPRVGGIAIATSYLAALALLLLSPLHGAGSVNLPFVWGAQPHNGLIYFNDINSGLWIVKLGDKIEKGSTTAPGW